jgi:hypothetical protein
MLYRLGEEKTTTSLGGKCLEINVQRLLSNVNTAENILEDFIFILYCNIIITLQKC